MWLEQVFYLQLQGITYIVKLLFELAVLIAHL